MSFSMEVEGWIRAVSPSCLLQVFLLLVWSSPRNMIMCWPIEPKHQRQSPTVQILSDSTVLMLHTYTWTFSHTLLTTPPSSVEPHSTVKAGETWEPHDIPHRTCRLSPQLRELQCGAVWCRRQTSGRGRQTSGSWTGGNAAVAWLVCQ